MVFCAASSQPLGDSDISSITFTTFGMSFSSVIPFEDRTRRGQRFLIDVWLRQLERVLDQLKMRLAFFGQQNFHDIEAKCDVGIIEQSEPGQSAFRDAQLFLSIHGVERPAEFFAAARFYF